MSTTDDTIFLLTDDKKLQRVPNVEYETEDPDAHIASFSEVGGDLDDPEGMVENYWDTVETNLRQGNVRLLFAADSIPRELRRIIEFLNEKMSTVEVLGVEIRQYQGRGISALVPRIVGQTETAKDSKSRSRAGTTERRTKDEFLDSQDGNVRAFWSRLVEQAEQSTEWSTSWGKALAIRMLSPASDKFRSVIFSNFRREDPCLSISLEYLWADYPDEIETLRDELMALGLDLGGKYRLWTWLNDDTLSLAEKAIEKTQLFFEQMKRVDQHDSHAKVAQV